MPNRNAKNGAAFERQVMRDLESCGYAATRSAGSHGPADVWAIRGGRCVLVQCKRNGRLDPDEWNEFIAFCTQAGAVPILAAKIRGGIDYQRLTGKKEGRGPQPMMPFDIEKGE